MKKFPSKAWASHRFIPRHTSVVSSRPLFFRGHIRTILSVAVLFFYSVSLTFAVPPSGGYAPGATLDPDCAPGDVDCTVLFTTGGGSSVTLPLPISDGGTGGITTVAARANLGLSYASAADLDSTMTIAAWGDSLTDGYTVTPNYPTYLSSMTGYSVYNGGVTAEVSSQIRSRMVADADKHDWPTIIWVGRNNYSNPTQVKADIAAMVSALGHDRYLVLSILNGDVPNEYQGEDDYNSIISLNNDLEALYGDNFLDIRSYLVSQYDSGDSDDIQDYSNDVVPGSLRFDYLHLNAAGYELVAGQIASHMDTLEPSGTQSVLTPTRAISMFAAPPVIGAITPNLGFFSAIGIGTNTPAFSFDTGAGGKYGIDGIQMMYLPNQDDFSGSIAFGNGGNNLSHSSGTEGRNNTFVGINAGLVNTTGYNNSVVGHNALYSNTSGYNNTVFGEAAMVSNQSGSNNSAFGQAALYANTTGSYNIAFGVSALNSNGSGSNNSAIGSAALNSNTSGSNNTAIGNSALVSNTTGGNNVAIGGTAGFLNQAGGYNVSIGYSALFSNVGGYSNTAIGPYAGYNATGSDNVFIGSRAGYNETGAGKLYIANSDTDSPLIYGDFGSSYLRLNGNVGVGTTVAPTARLDVVGAELDTVVVKIGTTGGNTCSFSTTTGTFSCASDSRLKHDITSIAATDALDKLKLLVPVTYAYNWQSDDESLVPGFIAQEFETVFPDLVSTDDETGYKSLSYAPLMPYVVSAIQSIDLHVAAFPSYDDEVFTVRLADFLKGIAERGEALIALVKSDKVETKELCVDDVCVTRDQFRAMVEQSGQVVSSPVVTPDPVEADPEEQSAPEESDSAPGAEPESTLPEENTEPEDEAIPEEAPLEESSPVDSE